MLISMDRFQRACTVIAFACCIFSHSPRLAAQSKANDLRPLVVVGDERDVACAQQIGGTAITVATPSAVGVELLEADYDQSNSIARGARSFSVYLTRRDANSRHESLWRERLTRENPLGRVHWVNLRRTTAEHDCQLAVQHVIEVHRILVNAFPERRQVFDDNLQVELLRLARLRFEPVSLASDNNKQ